MTSDEQIEEIINNLTLYTDLVDEKDIMSVSLVHYLRLMKKFNVQFKHQEYLQVLGQWHGRQINAYDKNGKYYVKKLNDYYDFEGELALITGKEKPKEEKYDRELIELMMKANHTAMNRK